MITLKVLVIKSHKKERQRRNALVSIVLCSIIVVGIFFYLQSPVKESSLVIEETPVDSADLTQTVQTVSTTESVKKYNSELDKLQQPILDILGTDVKKYAIVVEDLHSHSRVTINADVQMSPASIYKVALALLILKDVDAKKFDLARTYSLQQKFKTYKTDSLYSSPNGKKYTLQQYIEYMLRDSDNTAMTFLESLIGKASVVNARISKELGLRIYRNPQETTATDIAKMFINIYNQTYLSDATSTFLINTLKNTAGWLQDRIPAGIQATNVSIAHKIGSLVNEDGLTHQDAGIVYTPVTDYVIVVLNKGVDNEKEAADMISKISELVYNYLITN